MKLSTRNDAGSRKFWVRMIALILAVLMILGVAAMAMAFIISAFAAGDPLAPYAFATSQETNHFYITAGIKYGTSVKKNYGISSPYGLIAGVADIPSSIDRSFTPLLNLGTTAVHVVSDENLSVSLTDATVASSASKTDIGAYHVEFTLRSGNVWNDLAALRAKYTTVYGFVFPAYANGTKTVRVGAFPTESEAIAAKNAITARGAGSYTLSVAAPSVAGTTVLSEDYSTILFEFSSAESDKNVGFCAVQKSGTERSYLCNGDTGYLYDGAFVFRPYNDGAGSVGFSMINLVGLGEYIEGVLPTEFLNTWPLESQKAAAVTICCYTLSGLGKRYSSYGFDLTCSSYDQNYFGRRKVTQLCIEGAEAVEGLAMTYGGSLITGYYGTSNGGWAVASNIAWVGVRGYLITHPTPWENYTDPTVKNGTWEREYTPEQILTRITNYRSGLKGTRVTSLETTTVSDECPVLYTLTAKDNKGNTITLEHSSAVYGAINTYSPNFAIAKGSVNYYYDEVLDTQIISLVPTTDKKVSVMTSSGIFNVPFLSFNFQTKNGKATSDSASALHIQTSGGIATVSGEGAGTLPAATKPDRNGNFTSVCEFGDFAVVTKNRRHTATLTASNPDNYVIYGKGSGHCVGMSQVGIYFLASAGATYDQILRAYYNDVDFVNVFDYLASKSK